MKKTEVKLRVEELEQRIAPSVTGPAGMTGSPGTSARQAQSVGQRQPENTSS